MSEPITDLETAVRELGALPMPVGPEPRDAEDELTGARLSLYEEEQESARLRLAWQSARCRAWEQREALRALRAEVAAMRAERHVTNEALSDAAVALRGDRDRIAGLEAGRTALAARLRAGQRWQRDRTPALVSQDFVGQDELRAMFGIPLTAPWDETDGCDTAQRSAGKLARLLAPSQALREAESAEEQPLTIYRAAHGSIVMGLYTTAAEARKHCETELRREYAESTKVSLWWREDEDTVDQPEDGEQELYVHATPAGMSPGRTWNSGYVVTPLEVASVYDPDGDE